MQQPRQANIKRLPSTGAAAPFALILLLSLLAGCTTGIKSIAPAVAEQAQAPGSWYDYIPQKAPGFCLRTRHSIIWKDPLMPLGHWQGLHPRFPHRVIMEAHGDTLILHRHYVWDGNSLGATRPADLLPSLRHDALYHALKEGAPLNRKLIDRAYLRDTLRYRSARFPGTRYRLLRLFGGLFNESGDKGTLIIRSAAKP